MKRIISSVQLTLSLCLVMAIVSCGDKDEGPSPSLEFDGSYNGIFTIQGIQIGTWNMVVDKGLASGSFLYITGSTTYTGTVYAGGKLEVNITYDDGSTTETVIAIKEDGTVSGTWANSETEFGELVGAMEAVGFDGTYNGVAFSEGMQTATWKLNISKGKASGTYSVADGTGMISGYIDSKGKLSIGSAFQTGRILTAQALVEEGMITGAWFDTLQESGTALGARATGAFDNDYTGTASANGIVIGTWTMNIAGGKATGTYLDDGESSAIGGFVSEAGDLYVGITFADGGIATVKGSIDGEVITGTWTDSDGQNGTMAGGR